MKLCGNSAKSKATKRPFMRLFTSDYRDGTVALSFELQGFYVRILTYLHDGESVPADPAALATFLHCNARTVRALLPKLIAAGKLYEADGLLRNKRVDRDLEPNSSPIETEVDLNSNGIDAELDVNSARTSEKPESNQEPENCTMEDSTSISTSISIPEPTSVVPEATRGCAAKKIDLDELEGKLRGACNGALANPAVAQGLFDLSTPLMWLNQGCDLDLDVLPTLRGIGQREHGKGIASWGYFTKPVTAALRRREAGLPAVEAAPVKSTRSNDGSNVLAFLNSRDGVPA
jgi:uncharacterized protein YdaU (DUF1376 family)